MLKRAVTATLAVGLLTTIAVAEDRTPPASEKGDPKTGSSPPVQAGGAGVKGKPDAGAGKSDEAPKDKK